MELQPQATGPRRPGDPLTWAWIGAMALAAIVLSCFGVADSDLFWHLKNGDEILSSLTIPTHDVYSHTAAGAYYAYYSWLAEVIAAGLYRLGGLPAVIGAKACAYGLLLLLLGLACRRRGADGLACACALLFGLLLLRFRFYARPELFTLLFLVAFDTWIRGYLKNGRRWRLVALVIGAAVWANLHPYVLFGMVVLGTHLCGATLDTWLRSEKWGVPVERLRGLLATTFLAMGATLCNPYGWNIFAPALKLFGSGTIAQLPTREWLPPSWDGFALFFLLAAGASLAMTLRWRGLPAVDGLLAAGTLVGALLALRNIGIYAVLVTPILAAALQQHVGLIKPWLDRRFPLRLAWCARTVFAGALVWVMATLLSPQASVLHLDQSRLYRWGFSLSRDSAPVAAVDFIETHRLSGPLFNSWAFGGYVIWRSWPERKVALDGRQMVYEAFLDRLARDGIGPTIRADGIRLGLVELRDAALIRAFVDTGDFAPVFFDDLAVVLVHREAMPPGVIPFETIRPWDLSLAWLEGTDSQALEAAVAEANRALAIAPGSARAALLLASLTRRSGDSDTSLAAIRRAIELDPHQATYHNHHGLLLLDRGQPEDAAAAFRRAVAFAPKDATLHYNLGLAWIEVGRERRARASFQRAWDRERAEAGLMLAAMASSPKRARGYLSQTLKRSRSSDLTQRAQRMLQELED